jgi:hypothetical protein
VVRVCLLACLAVPSLILITFHLQSFAFLSRQEEEQNKVINQLSSPVQL